MQGHDLAKLAVSALSGAALGWAAQALTLTGRVDAIEKSLQRIEAALYAPAARAPGHEATAKP